MSGDDGYEHGYEHGYRHGHVHGHPGAKASTDAAESSRPKRTGDQIAESDRQNIVRMTADGRLGARLVKENVYRLWHPDHYDDGERLDIYLLSGRLFRAGQKIEPERGLRDALTLLGIERK